MNRNAHSGCSSDGKPTRSSGWRLGQVAGRSNLRDVRGTRDRDFRTAGMYRWQRLLALYGRLTRTREEGYIS
jgi:hypothetical protein